MRPLRQATACDNWSGVIGPPSGLTFKISLCNSLIPLSITHILFLLWILPNSILMLLLDNSLSFEHINIKDLLEDAGSNLILIGLSFDGFRILHNFNSELDTSLAVSSGICSASVYDVVVSRIFF